MTDLRTVTLTRHYDARPDQVWAAWTDVSLLSRWYGCQPDQLWTIHEWDVRVGGAVHVSMDFDGNPFVVTGEFVEVEAPTRLRYRFGDPQTITVDIEAHEDGATMTVTHDGLSDEQMVGIVTDGWSSSLVQIGRALSGSAAATEALVTEYWMSWQGSEPDWAAMRRCLADEIDMEHGAMPADDLVAMAQQGNPWSSVEMVDLVATPTQAALLYRGTDSASGEVVDVAEFLTVGDGKIAKLRGIIPMG